MEANSEHIRDQHINRLRKTVRHRLYLLCSDSCKMNCYEDFSHWFSAKETNYTYYPRGLGLARSEMRPFSIAVKQMCSLVASLSDFSFSNDQERIRRGDPCHSQRSSFQNHRGHSEFIHFFD